jgi:type III secretion system FlhB-like substrate exporter
VIEPVLPDLGAFLYDENQDIKELLSNHKIGENIPMFSYEKLSY